MRKLIKNILLGGAFVFALYNSPIKAEEPQLNLGYNVLETAVTTKTNPSGENPIRNRLLTNLALDVGYLELGYHGLNEIDNLNPVTYFGRNRLMIGKQKSPLKILVDTKATKEGIFDTKWGFRNTNLMSKLRGYGDMDLSSNKKSLNLRLFYGKSLEYGLSIELLQDTTFNYHKKPNHYTELQLNKTLTDRLSLFGRVEIFDFDKNQTKYLGGLGFNLRGK